MSVAVVFCAVLVILWYFWYKIKEVRTDKGYEKPPELKGKLPLIGHAHMFLCDNTEIWNLSKRIAKESLEQGGLITFSLGPKTFYAVTDPDDCATVSNQCLDKSYVYDFAKNWLGNGILTADVETWKIHRKLLSPAFSQKTVESFMGVFNEQAKCLVDKMSEHVGRGPFDHGRYMASNSLEIICRTAFGVDPEKHRALIDNYLQALDEIQDILLERFRKPWLHSEVVYKWSFLKSKETAVLKILNDLSDTVLGGRKRIIENNYNTGSENFKPFMDTLLELGVKDQVYNDKEIRDETNTIIFGGHDTSSAALIFILILIGSYPDVQDKVYLELMRILGNKGDVTRKNVSKLIYLEAVVKETLRLYPIGPLVARHAKEDVKLKNYTLPARSDCFLNFWGLHHHPIWGPDVEVFRPERWLDSTLPKNPNAFGAFHIGKRSCIGRVYAMMSMKTTLAHLLRHYRIRGDVTKLVVKLETFLKPASGHYISIEKRI